MGFLANCDTTIVPTRAAFAVSECRSSLPLTAPLLSPKIVLACSSLLHRRFSCRHAALCQERCVTPLKTAVQHTRLAAELTKARVNSLPSRKFPPHARKTSGTQGSFQAIVEVFQLVNQTNLSNTLIHFNLKPLFSSFFHGHSPLKSWTKMFQRIASLCTDVLKVQKDNEMWRFAFL